MTYITKHLPDLKTLKKELKEYPDNIRIYSKYEGFIGDSKSMDYLRKKIKEYYKFKKDNK